MEVKCEAFELSKCLQEGVHISVCWWKQPSQHQDTSLCVQTLPIMPLSPSCTAAQIGFADISRPPTWSFMFAATSIHEKPVSGEQSSLGNSQQCIKLCCCCHPGLPHRPSPLPNPIPQQASKLLPFIFYRIHFSQYCSSSRKTLVLLTTRAVVLGPVV